MISKSMEHRVSVDRSSLKSNFQLEWLASVAARRWKRGRGGRVERHLRDQIWIAGGRGRSVGGVAREGIEVSKRGRDIT